MAEVELRQLHKSFGGLEVLAGVDIVVPDRSFTVFVGPSGCGKSTLLRLIAGLEDISAGDLLINGVRVNDEPPAKRGIAMVFQSYALYPHMTVAQNISFSLRVAKAPKDVIQRRTREVARMLQLDELLERKPAQLSGGQRQRVAIVLDDDLAGGRGDVHNGGVAQPLEDLHRAGKARPRVAGRCELDVLGPDADLH